jgi:hypothetical protein
MPRAWNSNHVHPFLYMASEDNSMANNLAAKKPEPDEPKARMPERSEAVAGNEKKGGLTPIPAGETKEAPQPPPAN